MIEDPLGPDADVGDHQVITRAGRVEAVVVPMEEYRALKALEHHGHRLPTQRRLQPTMHDS
jgi:hypothetical protein